MALSASDLPTPENLKAQAAYNSMYDRKQVMVAKSWGLTGRDSRGTGRTSKSNLQWVYILKVGER
jgi:hypothetical protein